MAKLYLDHQASRAFWSGVDANLTVTEWRVIQLLASRPGSYFSYRKIYDHMRCRPGMFAGQGELGVRVNVRTAIKRVRRKFTTIDPQFDAIMTYTSYGYGLERNALDGERCCPTCGQIILVMRDLVVGVAPTRETVADHAKEVTAKIG